ncbi:uncharacterized protein N7459_005493 [Penicillium hispanicum]|uniref:uncharacterized protein n=1 Tax=Penicillium hispanicum TaxID=1080232 RepID=UPI00254115B7|nr:uncharacterized protein N7459_005493 [Penicillium hispanicum]KAJ5579508.1 hypothetical protein N7459_005493 [Penicillium hispanicum]
MCLALGLLSTTKSKSKKDKGDYYAPAPRPVPVNSQPQAPSSVLGWLKKIALSRKIQMDPIKFVQLDRGTAWMRDQGVAVSRLTRRKV